MIFTNIYYFHLYLLPYVSLQCSSILHQTSFAQGRLIISMIKNRSNPTWNSKIIISISKKSFRVQLSFSVTFSIEWLSNFFVESKLSIYPKYPPQNNYGIQISWILFWYRITKWCQIPGKWRTYFSQYLHCVFVCIYTSPEL